MDGENTEKAGGAMFMCRLCNLFSPSRGQLLVHCSQKHPLQAAARYDDLIVAMQPLSPETTPVSAVKRKRGRPKGSTKKRRPDWAEVRAGPARPSQDKGKGEEEEEEEEERGRAEEKKNEAECQATLGADGTKGGVAERQQEAEGATGGATGGSTEGDPLLCRRCHRSFSNPRQILKHICLKVEEEEEEEEEHNGPESSSGAGEPLGSSGSLEPGGGADSSDQSQTRTVLMKTKDVERVKTPRSSKRSRTPCTDRRVNRKEAGPAAGHRKSIISVVLTEHETLADATKMVPVEASPAEMDPAGSQPQDPAAPQTVSQTGDCPASNPTSDPASSQLNGESPKPVTPAANRGFQEYAIKQVSNSLQSQLKIFTCEFCNKIFKFRHSLTAHLRTHTQEKPFQCPHCDYASAIKANLNVHLRKHTGEKFSCPHCSFTCLSPGHLKVHVERVHLKVKQHCEFCPKKYSDVKTLLRHMEQRHDLKHPDVQHSYQQLRLKTRQGQRQLLYHCSTCGRRFKNHLERQRHLLVHGPLRPYACLLCDHATTNMATLAAHVRKHLFLYVCCLCGGAFVSSPRLRAHLAESHPAECPSPDDAERAFADCIARSYCLAPPGDGAEERRGEEWGEVVVVVREEQGGERRPEGEEMEGGESEEGRAGEEERREGEEEGRAGEEEGRREGEEEEEEGRAGEEERREGEEEEEEEGRAGEEERREGEEEEEEGRPEEFSGEREQGRRGEGVEGEEREGGTAEQEEREGEQEEEEEEEGRTASAQEERREEEGEEEEEGRTASAQEERREEEGEKKEAENNGRSEPEAVAGPKTAPPPPPPPPPAAGDDGQEEERGDETPDDGSEGAGTGTGGQPQSGGDDQGTGTGGQPQSGGDGGGPDAPVRGSETETTPDDDAPTSEHAQVEENACAPEADGAQGQVTVEDSAEQTAFQQVLSSLQKTQLNMETFQRLRKLYGDLECQYCGKLFWYQAHYNLHVRTHTKEHMHHCSKCSYSSITKSCLKRHLVQKHSGLLLPCSEAGCAYATPDKYKLQAHEKTHQQQRTEACPVCQQKYPENRLKHHIRTAHPDAEHNKGVMVKKAEKCPYCDSYFLKNSSDLQQHIWAHQGVKPYRCNVCDYAGRSRSNLRAHMNTHSSERTHLCDLCGKKFKSKVTLKTHRLTHSAEGRRFHCSECDYTSVSKPTLLRHMEQHADFKPYRCGHCHYSCNIAGPLKRHYNRKHPEQEYQNAGPGLSDTDAVETQGALKCPVCKFVYGTKWELNRHLKNRHNLKLVEGHSAWEVLETAEGQYVSVEDEEQQTEEAVAALQGNAGAVNILQQIIELSSENPDAVASVVTMAPGTVTVVTEQVSRGVEQGSGNRGDQVMVQVEAGEEEEGGGPGDHRLMVVEETEGLETLTVLTTTQGDSSAHHYIVYVEEQTVEIN